MSTNKVTWNIPADALGALRELDMVVVQEVYPELEFSGGTVAGTPFAVQVFRDFLTAHAKANR